ncbi:hypothetical protein KUTeg_016157, partial [Tegillarca granosa]
MSWSFLSAVRKQCIEVPLSAVSVSLLPCRHKHIHRKYLSKRLDYINKNQPEDSKITCKSQKLMIYNNIIDHCYPGAYHLLPLGVRVLEKLIKIIDFELEAIGALKMQMPILAPSKLWKKSGRWKTTGSELFRLKDRNQHEYCLGPTHEEIITELVAQEGYISYRNLPMMLYQINTKFRDESWPKFGLLRGREFEMKDMYTFDASEDDAMITYEQVCEVYGKIFDRLKIKYIKVLGSTGNIGGKLSHEFHFPADVGEDTVKICESCGYGANVEVLGKENTTCPECNSDLKQLTCIEVGHSFLLGTKYSDVFNAKFTEGYKADEMKNLADELYDELNEGEVVIDDRTKLSVGKRLFTAKRKGFPYVVVVGRQATETPVLYEVIDMTNDETKFMEKHELLKLMADIETTKPAMISNILNLDIIDMKPDM